MKNQIIVWFLLVLFFATSTIATPTVATAQNSFMQKSQYEELLGLDLKKVWNKGLIFPITENLKIYATPKLKGKCCALKVRLRFQI